MSAPIGSRCGRGLGSEGFGRACVAAAPRSHVTHLRSASRTETGNVTLPPILSRKRLEGALGRPLGLLGEQVCEPGERLVRLGEPQQSPFQCRIALPRRQADKPPRRLRAFLSAAHLSPIRTEAHWPFFSSWCAEPPRAVV